MAFAQKFAILALTLVAPLSLSAATFAIDGPRVELSGRILPGDAARLAAYLNANWKDRETQPVVSLNSPGTGLYYDYCYALNSIIRRVVCRHC